MTIFHIPAPEPATHKLLVHPVFLSFRGCPTRCVFCEQSLQTGLDPRPFGESFSCLEHELADLAARNAPPRELAFYGGTFTLLPPGEQAALLGVAAKYKASGLVTRVRASTRPDAVTAQGLGTLRDAGMDMLELGVQSFADRALAASNRGYDGKTAQDACRAVTESGLLLGIQLMPGMPGMKKEDFMADGALACALAPSVLRLYPCLVLAGTELASMHGRGEYAPWSLQSVIPLLAEVQLRAWDARVRVIRIGLAPQAELDDGGVTAGPRHPALGSMVRGEALFRYLARELSRYGCHVANFAAPARFQGEFWGHKGMLKEAYAVLNITPATLTWHSGPHFEVRYRSL